MLCGVLLADIGYIYQDCEELKKEESTQEYDAPVLLDATLEGRISSLFMRAC